MVENIIGKDRKMQYNGDIHHPYKDKSLKETLNIQLKKINVWCPVENVERIMVKLILM